MKHGNSAGEKSRKSLTVIKRSPVSWIRLNLKVVSSETKDAIFKKISRSILHGAKVGREIIVGANSICRLFESGRVAIVAVCRDSNHCLTDHVIEAARIRRVPIVILPKAALELALLLRLKRISCFALCSHSEEVCGANGLKVSSPIDPKLVIYKKTSLTESAVGALTESISSASAILDDGSDSAKHDSSGETTGEENSTAQKTDDEIAAALILPAAMDDLRDLLLSVSSAQNF